MIRTVDLVPAVLLTLVGGGLYLAPAWTPRLPVSDKAALPAVSQAAAEAATLQPAQWARYWDHSRLPPLEKPVRVEVKSDPAEALKQWQVTGILLADGSPLITVKNGTAWRTLRQEDTLEGYVFSGISGRSAQFTGNGPILELSLPDDPSG